PLVQRRGGQVRAASSVLPDHRQLLDRHTSILTVLESGRKIASTNVDIAGGLAADRPTGKDQPMSEQTDLRETVRARYAAAARDELPAEAVAASLGCGNPTAVAELREGEVVLDLGSGGGIDVLLSARRVGPTGKAYGVDMTEEMLALARTNAAKAGAT